MNPLQPYLYLTMISQISFVVSLYGLFTFFSIASEFGLLQDKKYGSKALLLKAMVIIVNLQVRDEKLKCDPWTYRTDRFKV